LPPGSAVDAQREDLHVEAEAADRAAGEQFKASGRSLGRWGCPSGQSRRTCGRCARAASAPPMPSRSRKWSSSSGCSDRRCRGNPGRSCTGLCLDPRGAQASPHVTLQLLWESTRLGTARRLPPQRLLPDLRGLGEAPEALDAPAALRRREAVRRLRRSHGADLWGRR